MLIRMVMPGVLLALCVVVHALVMTVLLRRLTRPARKPIVHFWPATFMLIRIALVMIFAHLFEIAIWASFLTWHHVFPDPRASFYFSAVTYTTVGYGDLVLPENWRLYAAVEGLTGILMCGWSTGVFFAVVSRMYPDQRANTTGVDRAAGR
jgi:hypothetical protein